jgi:hypothetical protein
LHDLERAPIEDRLVLAGDQVVARAHESGVRRVLQDPENAILGPRTWRENATGCALVSLRRSTPRVQSADDADERVVCEVRGEDLANERRLVWLDDELAALDAVAERRAASRPLAAPTEPLLYRNTHYPTPARSA